jgi:hypothetical protein
MDGWMMDGWMMDGWMDGWMDGLEWMNSTGAQSSKREAVPQNSLHNAKVLDLEFFIALYPHFPRDDLIDAYHTPLHFPIHPTQCPPTTTMQRPRN